jgi:sulfate permease, SulP family
VNKRFEPQLVSVLKEGYTRKLFTGDLTSGIITGIVALPLAIAFAIAGGVSPEQGFYTAIIAGFIISVLSGSRVQIGGPTGAFVVMIYAIIVEYGIEGLAVATIMAGLILVLMGIMRLGVLIKYIPYPVTQGFTSGIAVVIASTQIKPLFGLEMAEVPVEFVPKIAACVNSIASFNIWAVVISGASLAIIFLFPRLSSRFPGSLAAIIAGTIVVHVFDLPVETIAGVFGRMSNSLPQFTVPEFDLSLIAKLFPAAVSIAMLGAIESLLSAVVADGMTGQRHRSNMELIAQGAANIICPFFGGIPATGAIARTATNIKNGGKTPIAGIVHAAVLLLILLFLGQIAGMIPMCILAAILISVAIKMSEYHLFIKMFRAPRSDVVVMLATLLLTVLLDLTIAIPAGMVMASFLFMHRMEQISGISVISEDEEQDNCDPMSLSRFKVPQGVEVFEIDGPFFFGAASKFQDDISGRKDKVLILRMRKVPVIDATGLFALEKIIDQARHNGQVVLLSGINSRPYNDIKKSGILRKIGKESIYSGITEALRHAEVLVNLNELPNDRDK